MQFKVLVSKLCTATSDKGGQVKSALIGIDVKVNRK